jgi:hypothetical protein
MCILHNTETGAQSVLYVTFIAPACGRVCARRRFVTARGAETRERGRAQREKGRSLSMALVAAPSMAQRAALSASLAPRARLFDV